MTHGRTFGLLLNEGQLSLAFVSKTQTGDLSVMEISLVHIRRLNADNIGEIKQMHRTLVSVMFK